MTRREHLRLLLDRVQRELAEEEARQARIEAARAAIQVPPDEEPDRLLAEAGPRRLPDIYSEEEARDAHARFAAGNREAWVVEAEMQYQRNRKRRSRERLSA